MKLGDPYKYGRTVISKIATGVITTAVPWIRGPLAFACTQAIKWLLNVCARPIYDYLERKAVLAKTNKDIDKKIEAVKTAKTEAEINQAIDEMP